MQSIWTLLPAAESQASSRGPLSSLWPQLPAGGRGDGAGFCDVWGEVFHGLSHVLETLQGPFW